MKQKAPHENGFAILIEKGKKSLYPEKIKISVQMGTCGRASGAEQVYEALEKEVQGKTLILGKTGCLGLCEREPMVNLFIPGMNPVVYSDLTPGIIPELVLKWKKGEVPEKNAFMQLNTRSFLPDKQELKKAGNIPLYSDIPFYKLQKKLVLKNCGFIDPDSIAEYAARGGFTSLLKILMEYTPEKTIELIESSGLRGRGGGGFPTGRKWLSCRNAPGTVKYVICNADEGDPGAYMDRTVLEGDPFNVIEGMIIGAYALGSHEGHIYVRGEYPQAVETLHHAITLARESGFLGDNILGTEFSFDITINRGGGAFVCGESTALMASLEGKVGEPRTKHVHTVVSGFRDMPTVLNNVETWANIPIIVSMGTEEYTKLGTENSKGTKVFSVVGNICNNGLVEIPMGISLKAIVEDIGGGIPGGKKPKAIQTGGPSGGCIPWDKADIPVDFDELTRLGSMMGSGGMLVMDEETCMVEVARYFLSFLVEESCGKCTPCREGTYQVYQILEKITQGKGKNKDLALMEELCETIRDTSLCALGKTAPNPVLSTLKYFRQEYEDHIQKKICRAGVCKALFEYQIDKGKCTGCMICLKKCPYSAIKGKRKEIHIIQQEKCTKCGICFEVCTFDAIKKV